MFEKLFRKKPKDEKVSPWPFSSPENEAVVTVSQILDGSLPILLVSHDASDGGWQFLTGLDVQMSDAKLVSLKSMTEHDPSLLELADLPEGWQAMRSSSSAPWVKAKT